MIRHIACAALALSLFAACNKQEPAPETTETVPVPTAAPATTAQQEQAAGQEVDDGLKLEEDFEEQAYEQVTADNLEQELAKLEQEIKDDEKAAAGAMPQAAKAAPKTPAP